MTAVDGRLDTVRLDRAILGKTDVSGSVHLPRGGPIVVDLSGPMLDVSAKLLETPTKPDPAAPNGPAWSVRGRFDHVLLAHDRVASQVVVGADDDGQIIRGLIVTGQLAGNHPFSMHIDHGPAGAGRRLVMNADDAGGLLHGLDATSSILGGTLAVTGDFDDTTPDHVLSGTIEMTDFRVARAPASGQIAAGGDAVRAGRCAGRAGTGLFQPDRAISTG